jgi:uncharacterized protein YecE (DUF72 family)
MGASANEKVFRVGCQSWQYDDWITRAGGNTIFYPRGTRPGEMLSLYSRIFDTIEVDSTAYGVPAASTLDDWAGATPENFVFSLKVPRAITHELSLSAPSFPIMDEFIDVSRRLKKRIGVILIQLPASFESTPDNSRNLRSFISRLPDDVRFAVEFRHPGWLIDWTFDELNERRIALCLVAGKWIPADRVLSAFARTHTLFAYTRLMGIRDLPRFDRVYRDRSGELQLWADKMKDLAANEVFVYVDNYFEGHGPATANKIKAALDIKISDAAELEPQGSLF